MKNKNKKILVTGVSGQLGSYMVDFLLKETKYEVVGCIRRTSQQINSHFKCHLDNPRFKLVHFDLCDSHSISSMIKNESPNYFINLGAQTFVADSWNTPEAHFSTNAIAMIHILESVRKFCPECRVYSSGTSEQFGDISYSPQDINHPFKPRSPYGASKCAAHHIVKVWRESYGLYVVQGILFNNESPRRQEYFLPRKISLNVARIKKAMNRGVRFDPIYVGNLDVKRDWSYAVDFVDGIWKMLNQEKPKDYVLASGECHSIRELIEVAFNAANIEGKWVGSGDATRYVTTGVVSDQLVVVSKELVRPAEVNLLCGDSTPAREELGWKPTVSFEELVKLMVLSDLESK